jgi:hypothetical protein
MAHSTLDAAQWDELPVAAGETWGIWIAASESWDAASGTENASSRTASPSKSRDKISIRGEGCDTPCL